MRNLNPCNASHMTYSASLLMCRDEANPASNQVWTPNTLQDIPGNITYLLPLPDKPGQVDDDLPGAELSGKLKNAACWVASHWAALPVLSSRRMTSLKHSCWPAASLQGTPRNATGFSWQVSAWSLKAGLEELCMLSKRAGSAAFWHGYL